MTNKKSIPVIYCTSMWENGYIAIKVVFLKEGLAAQENPHDQGQRKMKARKKMLILTLTTPFI